MCARRQRKPASHVSASFWWLQTVHNMFHIIGGAMRSPCAIVTASPSHESKQRWKITATLHSSTARNLWCSTFYSSHIFISASAIKTRYYFAHFADDLVAAVRLPYLAGENKWIAAVVRKIVFNLWWLVMRIADCLSSCPRSSPFAIVWSPSNWMRTIWLCGIFT